MKKLKQLSECNLPFTYTIVVAKYLENIDWISKYDIISNTIIYDKSGEADLDSSYNIIPIKNFGRESHSYLYHIINNYDNLSDVLIFTQGDPEPHTDLDLWVEDMYQAFLTGYFNRWEFGSCNGHTGYYFNIHSYGGVPMELIDMTFGEWFSKVMGEDFPCPIIWKPGASGIVVSSDLIKTRPKEFYQMLYNRLDDKCNPAEGHFFERSWHYIFNCHKYSKNIINTSSNMDTFLTTSY
jgi:hypothetical protein